MVPDSRTKMVYKSLYIPSHIYIIILIPIPLKVPVKVIAFLYTR